MKKCSKCGLEKELLGFHNDKRNPDGKTNDCKSCAIKRAKEHYYNNKKHHKESMGKWREEHQGWIKNYMIEYRTKNKDGISNWHKEYRILNREKLSIQRKKYRQENLDKVKMQHKLEYSRHKDKYKIHKMKRRLAEGKCRVGIKDIRNIYKSQKGQCFYCGNELRDYHIDHIIPISRGGENKLYNLVISCPSCNYKKHNLPPEEFVDKILSEAI